MNECVNTSKGNQLLYEAGRRTNELLQPKLTYIPWIVVDGKHSDYIQGTSEFSLLAFLCNEFQVREFRIKIRIFKTIFETFSL